MCYSRTENKTTQSGCPFRPWQQSWDSFPLIRMTDQAPMFSGKTRSCRRFGPVSLADEGSMHKHTELEVASRWFRTSFSSQLPSQLLFEYVRCGWISKGFLLFVDPKHTRLKSHHQAQHAQHILEVTASLSNFICNYEF